MIRKLLCAWRVLFCERYYVYADNLGHKGSLEMEDIVAIMRKLQEVKEDSIAQKEAVNFVKELINK